MTRFRVGVVLASLFAVAAMGAGAQVTITSGAGSAVSSVDRIATFDNVVTNDDLTNYTEGNLIISVNGFAYEGYDPTWGNGGFSGGFHYPSGGANGATVIKAADGADLQAIEFNIGSGFSGGNPDFHYFIFNNGVLLSDAYFTVPVGSVVGFIATTAIDEIRLGAYGSTADAVAANQNSFQAIALDNLKVQIDGVAAVPEPGTYGLLAGMLVPGAAFLIRRRRA
jgi:hypothetical protein